MCVEFWQTSLPLKNKHQNKLKTNKRTSKSTRKPLSFVCYCCFGFRLMYGLKGALRAKLQDRLPHNASRTKHEQFKGWKPVLPFQTLAKYRLFTSMAHDSTHCSPTFMYSEWDADMGGGRAIYLLSLIQSWTWKSVHKLFLKESKEELQRAGFEYCTSYLS